MFQLLQLHIYLIHLRHWEAICRFPTPSHPSIYGYSSYYTSLVINVLCTAHCLYLNNSSLQLDNVLYKKDNLFQCSQTLQYEECDSLPPTSSKGTEKPCNSFGAGIGIGHWWLYSTLWDLKLSGLKETGMILQQLQEIRKAGGNRSTPQSEFHFCSNTASYPSSKCLREYIWFCYT